MNRIEGSAFAARQTLVGIRRSVEAIIRQHRQAQFKGTSHLIREGNFLRFLPGFSQEDGATVACYDPLAILEEFFVDFWGTGNLALDEWFRDKFPEATEKFSTILLTSIENLELSPSTFRYLLQEGRLPEIGVMLTQPLSEEIFTK